MIFEILFWIYVLAGTCGIIGMFVLDFPKKREDRTSREWIIGTAFDIVIAVLIYHEIWGKVVE